MVTTSSKQPGPGWLVQVIGFLSSLFLAAMTPGCLRGGASPDAAVSGSAPLNEAAVTGVPSSHAPDAALSRAVLTPRRREDTRSVQPVSPVEIPGDPFASCRGGSECIARAILDALDPEGVNADLEETTVATSGLRDGRVTFWVSRSDRSFVGWFKTTTRALRAYAVAGGTGRVKARLAVSARGNGRYLLMCAQEACEDPTERHNDARDACARRDFKANIQAFRLPCVLFDERDVWALPLFSAFDATIWHDDSTTDLVVDVYSNYGPDDLQRTPSALDEAMNPHLVLCPGKAEEYSRRFSSWGPSGAFRSIVRPSASTRGLEFVRFEGPWYYSPEVESVLPWKDLGLGEPVFGCRPVQNPEALEEPTGGRRMVGRGREPSMSPEDAHTTPRSPEPGTQVPTRP